MEEEHWEDISGTDDFVPGYVAARELARAYAKVFGNISVDQLRKAERAFLEKLADGTQRDNLNNKLIPLVNELAESDKKKGAPFFEDNTGQAPKTGLTQVIAKEEAQVEPAQAEAPAPQAEIKYINLNEVIAEKCPRIADNPEAVQFFTDKLMKQLSVTEPRVAEDSPNRRRNIGATLVGYSDTWMTEFESKEADKKKSAEPANTSILAKVLREDSGHEERLVGEADTVRKPAQSLEAAVEKEAKPEEAAKPQSKAIKPGYLTGGEALTKFLGSVNEGFYRAQFGRDMKDKERAALVEVAQRQGIIPGGEDVKEAYVDKITARIIQKHTSGAQGKTSATIRKPAEDPAQYYISRMDEVDARVNGAKTPEELKSAKGDYIKIIEEAGSKKVQLPKDRLLKSRDTLRDKTLMLTPKPAKAAVQEAAAEKVAPEQKPVATAPAPVTDTKDLETKLAEVTGQKNLLEEQKKKLEADYKASEDKNRELSGRIDARGKEIGSLKEELEIAGKIDGIFTMYDDASKILIKTTLNGKDVSDLKAQYERMKSGALSIAADVAKLPKYAKFHEEISSKFGETEKTVDALIARQSKIIEDFKAHYKDKIPGIEKVSSFEDAKDCIINYVNSLGPEETRKLLSQVEDLGKQLEAEKKKVAAAEEDKKNTNSRLVELKGKLDLAEGSKNRLIEAVPDIFISVEDFVNKYNNRYFFMQTYKGIPDGFLPEDADGNVDKASTEDMHQITVDDVYELLKGESVSWLKMKHKDDTLDFVDEQKAKEIFDRLAEKGQPLKEGSSKILCIATIEEFQKLKRKTRAYTAQPDMPSGPPTPSEEVLMKGLADARGANGPAVTNASQPAQPRMHYSLPKKLLMFGAAAAAVSALYVGLMQPKWPAEQYHNVKDYIESVFGYKKPSTVEPSAEPAKEAQPAEQKKAEGIETKVQPDQKAETPAVVKGPEGKPKDAESKEYTDALKELKEKLEKLKAAYGSESSGPKK